MYKLLKDHTSLAFKVHHTTSIDILYLKTYFLQRPMSLIGHVSQKLSLLLKNFFAE